MASTKMCSAAIQVATADEALRALRLSSDVIPCYIYLILQSHISGVEYNNIFLLLTLSKLINWEATDSPVFQIDLINYYKRRCR